jgi:SWIM zinc finger
LVATLEQAYRYLGPSEVLSGSGRVDVCLSTSGGTSAARVAEHPRLFDGFLARPEVAATALLVCARVARTRFYMPPNMVAAKIRAADPVVTSNGDRLRFESFSACCGVYSRLDVLPDGLDPAPLSTGTTNVDFNPPMRGALACVSVGEPLHLQVGLNDVTVSTLDDRVVERKVPLPERWLKGFAEVQVAAARMARLAELSGVEARRFLRSLPASARRPLWAVPAGGTLRLTSRPARGAACLVGPQRLRVLEPLIRFASSLRVYGPSVDVTADCAASAWELSCDDARIVVVLSPEVSRGFSGEGGVLVDLSDDSTADDADLVAALLAWEPRIDVTRLARDTALDERRVTTALTQLGAAGRVGFDLSEGSYFHRELPYNRDVLEWMHPRLRDARALVAAGAVTLTGTGALVRSGDVTHRVTTLPDGARCTCPWWGRHRGTRGPCKHVLAATMVTRE